MNSLFFTTIPAQGQRPDKPAPAKAGVGRCGLSKKITAYIDKPVEWAKSG
jgi:hypothetical protein